MVGTAATAAGATLKVEPGPGGDCTLRLAGRLDATTTGDVWRAAIAALEQESPAKVVVDASELVYCDGVGAALLVEIERRQRAGSGSFELVGLRADAQRLVTLFEDARLEAPEVESAPRRSLPEELGRATVQTADDLASLVEFVGAICSALLYAALHPRSVRWRDVLIIAERAGVNALPILVMINLLMGLIMAFEAVQALKLFGAEIFVADMVALSTLRELGPLMTAILLAGRSGSAFAAELGTMKVNEEVNALTTMGLDPLRFLATPRVLAGILVMPVLTLVADFFALVGGAIVYGTAGFPLVTYINQIQGRVDLGDLLAGLAKAMVFGVLVSAIGCQRGFQTGTGASAVGISATRAVVSGLFLIVVTDGVFSVVYNALGI